MEKMIRRKIEKKEANPIPRVPPVTRAVIPSRNHLGFLVLRLLLAVSAMAFWAMFLSSFLTPLTKMFYGVWTLVLSLFYIFLKPHQVTLFVQHIYTLETLSFFDWCAQFFSFVVWVHLKTGNGKTLRIY